MKKGIIEISTVITLIMFLGTGIYNMYKIEKRDPQYKADKPEDQKMCIEALKLSISK